MFIQLSVNSLVNMAAMTYQNGAQARDLIVPGAKCSISSDDGSVNYLTGIVECVDPNADGNLYVTVMDNLWPALKFTAQNATEFTNTTTRNLVTQFLSPWGVQVSGISGVTHKKAVLNMDEKLSDAIYRYADRAGVFVTSTENGADIRNIGDASGVTLDQSKNMSGWHRPHHYMPPKTKVLSTQSANFAQYAQSVGDSGFFDAQVAAGSLSVDEARNRAKIVNWRVVGDNDCLTTKIDPSISLIPGQSVYVKCPSAGVKESRIVRQLTIRVDCRGQKFEKEVELVPLYE